MAALRVAMYWQRTGIEISVLEKEGELHGQNQRCPLGAGPRSQDVWEIKQGARESPLGVLPGFKPQPAESGSSRHSHF